jgi:hypothetical protein
MRLTSIAKNARTTFTSLALLGIASSLFVAMPARADGPTYTYQPTVESNTVQTPLCAVVSAVCNNTFGFGIIGKTLIQGSKDLPSLETKIDFKTNLTGWFQDFSEPLNIAQIISESKVGRTPVITWEPQKIGDKNPDNYPLKSIIAGTFDKYLVASAKLAKSAGTPFVLRFAHEMNGYWYPWGIPKPGDPRSLATITNTPQIYVAAYRHIHDIFVQQGATNVEWMWSPNLIDATPNVTLSTLYPGDDYVDVVGLSGYLHGSDFMYEARFRPTLNQLDVIAPTKPIIIAEGGVDHALARAALTSDLLAGLDHEPRVQGFLWLNKIADVYDYSISDDQAVLDAIKNELHQPAATRTPSYTAAITLRAKITGEAIVGATVSAQGNYRGTALSTRYSWISCPTPTSAIADCTNEGFGPYHVITQDDRHRYLQVTLAAKSLAGYDFSRSPFFGPILTPQSPATLPTAYTRGTSTQLVFGPAPAEASNLVIQLDSNTPIFMPASTSEYWFNNLAIGSSHTFVIRYADVFGTSKMLGDPVTGSFTAAGPIASPAINVDNSTLTVTLGTPAEGQTAWRYQVDSSDIQNLDVAMASFTSENLAVGAHTFSLWAISGNASTLTKTYSFNVLPTPVAPSISMQSGAIWLTFAKQPVGITSVLIYVDNRSPIVVAAYGSQTYKITELTNGTDHTVSLRYAIINNTQRSTGPGSSSSFNLIAAPTGATGKVKDNGVLFNLPSVLPGQTGWQYSLDGGAPVPVAIDQTGIYLTDLSVAPHTFSLQAISRDGITLPQNLKFDYGSMPDRPTLNLRSSAVQFVFAKIPNSVTHVLLTIDGGTEIDISPTSNDYWVNNLTLQSSHTYSLRYERMIFGAPSFGAAITGSFAVLKSPETPVINSSASNLTVTFPTAVTGQKYWAYSIDGADYVRLDSSTTSIQLPPLTSGTHVFKLEAGADEGFSLENTSTFKVIDAPVMPTYNLRGTGTQFLLPPSPTSVSKILVSINDAAAVELSSSTTEYWANNLNLGDTYSFNISYKYVSGSATSYSAPTSISFTPLKSPSQASLDATGSNLVVTLPQAATGQTVWAYSVDGGPLVSVSVSVTSLTLDSPSVGSHSFDLYAGSGSALTLAKTTTFVKYSAPAVPVVNLRGTGTQLSFSAAPVGVAKIVIQVDNLTPVQLGPTSVEYWINGLDLGTSHTFQISYLYVNSYATVLGDQTTGNFVSLKSSDAVSVKVNSFEYTVTLPTLATGQTGWLYSIDGGTAIAVGVETLKLSLTVPATGDHSVTVQAVGGLGSTLPKSTTFTYLAAPSAVAAVLSGTGTKMTFGAAPAGVTNLVVQVDDLAPVYLPVSTTEYWVNNLVKGSSHVFKAWYKTASTGISIETPIKTLNFVPLSAPSVANITVTLNSALASIPTAATGQTGWAYSLENELNYVVVDASTTSVLINNLGAGTHKFYLKAIGKDGLTNSVVKSFTVS